MVRGAAIGFVVSMLLTTAAAWLMLAGTVHAQQAPRHVFSGAVRNAGDDVHFGDVSFLDMSGQEVANVNVSDARYKIAVVQPAGRNYSGQAFRITVHFGDRIYERAQRVNWQAGGVTVLDLEFGAQAAGWSFRRAPSQAQRQQDQQRMEQNAEDRDRRKEMDEQRMERENREGARRMELEEQRMKMEQQRMESEDVLRREQMKLQSERQEKEGTDRREAEQQRRESEEQRRREQGEREAEMRENENKARRKMEQQRMESEEGLRREQMNLQAERQEREGKERIEMERQRMEQNQQRMERDQQRRGPGQPGVQPVAGERPKSGPSRGLFSNNKAGEATSGIDNIMDPGTLTIIGIVLTVLTTGMTLFKGD